MSWKNRLDRHIEHCETVARFTELSEEYDDRELDDNPFEESGTHVYFITDGVYMKIGVAGDITRRLLELQTGNARKLIILMDIEYKNRTAAFVSEGSFHKHFEDKRLVGEWFDIVNDREFMYYFFRQHAVSDEALKFMLCRAVRINYKDPDYSVNERINDLKYEYLDWYDVEGRKKQFDSVLEAVNKLRCYKKGCESRELSA